MLRVLKGQPSTLSVPRDTKPTSATVTITRDRDATSIASAASCNVEADRVTYSLAAQSSVSTLTAVFTIVDAQGTSTVTMPVQVVGTRTASISDCRRLRPLDDVNRYPDELIQQTITEIEDQLEQACGVSFVPVERVGVKYDGSGTGELFTRHARPQSVSKITITDVDTTDELDQADLDALRIDEEAGVLLRPTYLWNTGRRNITVTGVFGYSQVPGLVKQAVVEGVRHSLVESRIDARAQSITSEDGTAQLVTAGVRGALFSLPALNQVVQMYKQSFGVA